MKNHTISTKKSKKKQVRERTTIGIDLGDQWSHYCVLDEVGEITPSHRKRACVRNALG